MSDVLQRGAALKHPPVVTAISGAASLGITGLFRSETTSGVLDRFYRTGSADRAQLIEAARVEQGFASPEGHAALYWLIGRVHGRLHRQGA